jgi:hypothetical protein
VSTSFDRGLQNSTLKATLDLDTVTIEVSPDKKKANVIVRPNLKAFGVNLDYFPLANGNFKVSGDVPIATFAKLALAFNSEDGKLSGNVTASQNVGPVQINAKVNSPEEGAVAASIFASVAAFSLGASATIGQTVVDPKVYAKYAKGDLAISTIISLLAGNKAKVECRARKGCPCRKEGGLAYGAVLSYTERASVITAGARFTCTRYQKSIGVQLGSDGSLRGSFSGKVPRYNASYSIAAAWNFETLELAALQPNLAINLTLDQK